MADNVEKRLKDIEKRLKDIENGRKEFKNSVEKVHRSAKKYIDDMHKIQDRSINKFIFPELKRLNDMISKIK